MEEKGKEIKRKSVLGKGLSALLTDANIHSEEAIVSKQNADSVDIGSVREIPISSIEPNPYQPRQQFEEDALEELAESIKAQGIIQPITVRLLQKGRYQLIAGERRLQASKIVGLDSIPAYIRVANDEQMLEMALIENIQREDLNPIEVAFGYQRLMNECKLIIEDIGRKVGKKRSTVNNYLRLLKLPISIQTALREEKLSMGHARALITIDNPLTQIAIFQDIVDKGISVRQVEEEVRNIGQIKPKIVTPTKTNAKTTPFQIQLREVQKQLTSKYGTKVQIINQDDEKGEVKFTYYSNEELNRLIKLLE